MNRLFMRPRVGGLAWGARTALLARLLGVLTALWTLAIPTTVSACTTCQCGSTPSATIPAGPPASGAWRVVSQAGWQRLRNGQPQVNELRVSEARLDFTAAWMSQNRWGVGANWAFVRRTVEEVSGAMEGGYAWTDPSLFAERLLLPASSPWLVAAIVGARLPLSNTLRSSSGERLNVDAQPAPAAWTPFVSLFVQQTRFTWQPVLQASLFVPARSRHGFQPGVAGLMSTGVLTRRDRWMVQLMADARLEAADEFDDGADPNSGGFMVAASPSVWFAASDTWLVGATTRIPLLQPARGQQTEGVIAQLTLAGQWVRRPHMPAPPVLALASPR